MVIVADGRLSTRCRQLCVRKAVVADLVRRHEPVVRSIKAAG